MVAPDVVCRCAKYVAQLRVVPSMRFVQGDTGLAVRAALESIQYVRDVGLGDLQFIGDRDAVAVVPDRQQHRHLQNADGVDGFPKNSLRAGGVPDGAEGDFIAAAAESVLGVLQFRKVTV